MRQPIQLAYGDTFLELVLDPAFFNVDIIFPPKPPSLKDPQAVFIQNAKTPLGSLPLKKLVPQKSVKALSVVIVISDHTRPVPDHLLIPWIVTELGVEDSCVTILVGTGTHRSPTNEELLNMLGPSVIDRFEIIVHDCKDTKNLVEVGQSRSGEKCWINKHYVEADVKIATGFIEPHFFAGYSGGSKAIVPGIAGLSTISYFHRPQIIADPLSTWGNIDHNPVLQLSREMTALCPPDCIINVTMDLTKNITGIYIGNHITAHEAGCLKAKKQHCVKVHQNYPVVVTTNSGHPLDLNFYQTVKGISAASTITEQGGTIIAASKCGNGLPEKSEFEKILSKDLSDVKLLNSIINNDITMQDQWQVQVLLQILQKNKVGLYSMMNKNMLKIARVDHVYDIKKSLTHIRRSLDVSRLPVAVLPYGPLTIPVY